MRSITDILDLTTEEIDELIKTSEQIMKSPQDFSKACCGKKLATLFFEPSTRTRLSFEAAMYELGGHVIGFSEPNNSSIFKGESLADTITTVGYYADIIAMRHPKEGSAKVATMYSKVPVINAGDGGHHHPTQTLADLCTIKQEKGSLNNLTLGLCGDLKYGRTVHSLINAFMRYSNIKFVLISPTELRIPDYLRQKMLEKGADFVEVEGLEEEVETLDILYMTRVQKERFANIEEYIRLKDNYILTLHILKEAKKDMIVLHPLPRVNEISTDVDSDSRACYFKQVQYGKYMRMALIMKLINSTGIEQDNKKTELIDGFSCENPSCITKIETKLKGLCEVSRDSKHRCAYCEREV